MNRCIFVVGMHRSGTSCLTGIMQGFGVELGEVDIESPYNKLGNREHPRIMQLNEALLYDNGGSWRQPVSVRVWSDAQIRERDSIIDALSKNGRSTGLWGCKDPRTLFTLPFWTAKVQPQLIGIFRHPVCVARSLAHRDGIPLDEGIMLWTIYNRRLLKMCRETGMPLVNFDLAPSAFLDDALSKLTAIGLDSKWEDTAKTFFCNDLRHQSISNDVNDIRLTMPVAQLYEQLTTYSMLGNEYGSATYSVNEM